MPETVTRPFVGSIVAGLTQVAVGQPLDTIKSCIQAHGIQGARERLRGPRCLYRGSRVSVANAVATNAIVFNAFHASMPWLHSPWACGLVAGLAATPTEFFLGGCKILRQMGWTSVTPKDMLRRPGVLSTCGRESVGFSMYFFAYNRLREGLNPMLAGAGAGLANWTFSYPIDVIRTRQVGLGMTLAQLHSRGMLTGGLWYGYPACALRAVVVNAAIFTAYELVSAF